VTELTPNWRTEQKKKGEKAKKKKKKEKNINENGGNARGQKGGKSDRRGGTKGLN